MNTKLNHNGKKKKNYAKLFFKTFCISIIVFIALFAAVGWWALKRAASTPPVITAEVDFGLAEPAFIDPERLEPHEEDEQIGNQSPMPEGFTLEDRKPLFYTFLIIGLDGGINTDTIMVAAYDGTEHKGYLIGIPRDSKVNVQRNVKKINAAYPIGTRNGGGKEGGVSRLGTEIKTIFGFIPDYYVLIDFKAFERIVDAVNGVEVEVPFAMIYDDPYQDLHINIPQGLQTLKGLDALRFARYRKGNNGKNTITDYQRIENQQAVITATLDKLLKPESLLKIPEFISIFKENVSTDIKPEEMLWFADQLKDVPGTDRLEKYTLPTTGTSGLPDYYELLDEAAIVELVNETVNPFTKDIVAGDLSITR